MRQRSPEQHLPYEPPLKLRRCLTCLTRGNSPSPGLCSDALQITAATQLIHAGMDIRTVADFLGHSDPSLTLRVYSHAIEERTRAAATIMGQVLAAKKEPAALPSGA